MSTTKQIEINKAYLVLSGVMGRPYVSPDRVAYLFLKKADANFAGALPAKCPQIASHRTAG